MKKVAVIGLVMIVCVASVGCLGPMHMTRSYDDWLNQSYVDSPWLVGNIVSTAFLSVVFVVTSAIDILVGNPYDFWTKSAPPTGSQGHGTPFDHKRALIPGK